jgi:hypothetical protein
MWRFQEVTDRPQNLHNWDAGNRAASWWNRRNHDSRLWRFNTPGTLCMDSQSQASSMSAAWVDKADEIHNFNNDGLCER